MQHRLLKLDSGITIHTSVLDLILLFELDANTKTSVVIWPRATATQELEVIILSYKCLYGSLKII